MPPFTGTNGIFDVILYDASGNPISRADAASLAAQHGVPVMGKTAADLARFLQVEDSGKLVVATTPPSPPPGTTEFVFAVSERELTVGAGGSVSSPHFSISAAIANGKTLYLQLFTVGTEGDPAEAGSVVAIYWREGTGPTDHLVERLFVNGETVTVPVPAISKARDGTVMLGDGTNGKLVVKRTRLSTAAKQVDFVVRGYTQ